MSQQVGLTSAYGVLARSARAASTQDWRRQPEGADSRRKRWVRSEESPRSV